jgi:uncharacterized protein YbjT (DUF2867 family)
VSLSVVRFKRDLRIDDHRPLAPPVRTGDVPDALRRALRFDAPWNHEETGSRTRQGSQTVRTRDAKPAAGTPDAATTLQAALCDDPLHPAQPRGRR